MNNITTLTSEVNPVNGAKRRHRFAVKWTRVGN